jgi:hypothetical protein
LTTPVVIVVVIVPVPHSLVVLTVSHIVPLDPALKIALSRNPSASILIGFRALFFASNSHLPPDPNGRDYLSHRIKSVAYCHTDLQYVAVNKDAFPISPGAYRRPHQVIPLAKTSTGFERDFSSAITGFRSLCGRKSSAA